MNRRKLLGLLAATPVAAIAAKHATAQQATTIKATEKAVQYGAPEHCFFSAPSYEWVSCSYNDSLRVTWDSD